MSAELRVTFLGEHQDARKAVAALEKLLQVVDAAERARGKPAHKVAWRFSRLRIGSVAAGITSPPSIDDDAAGEVFDRIVMGFGAAEERVGMPAGWTLQLARLARDLLDKAENHEVRIETLRDHRPVHTTVATEAARRHLDASLGQGTRESIGSVIGQLETVSVHGQNVARLWPERGGSAVEVNFKAEQLDEVKDHLGYRVQASGRLRRDAIDRPVKLWLRRLERLREFTESPPLAGLSGLDPDFTGRKSAGEYLREMRGEAR